MPKGKKKIIDALLSTKSLKTLVHEIVDRDADGNMKQWADACGISYIDLCRSFSVMQKLAEHHGFRLFTAEQVKRIRRYVETLEGMIE